MELKEQTPIQTSGEPLTAEVAVEDVDAQTSQPQPLSKNQQKKMKKREYWLEIKQDKRRNAKLKRKARLAEMRENGEDTGPTRKSLKRKTMKDSTCKIRVVIDLGFDEYMSEKDVNSLTCQLQHSYAANRRADNSLQLYLCGIDGKTKERLDRIGDYKGWDIYPDARPYDQVFPKESIVYLSSESDNILTTLTDDKVYVIGGLVDHNKHKGLCHRLAEEKGIAHAQLPIADFLDMKTRKVLTVNQVFTMLVRYTESQDWQQAFMSEMPQRKQALAREEPSSRESESKGDTTKDTNSLSCEESDISKAFVSDNDVPQTKQVLVKDEPSSPAKDVPQRNQVPVKDEPSSPAKDVPERKQVQVKEEPSSKESSCKRSTTNATNSFRNEESDIATSLEPEVSSDLLSKPDSKESTLEDSAAVVKTENVSELQKIDSESAASRESSKTGAKSESVTEEDKSEPVKE